MNDVALTTRRTRGRRAARIALLSLIAVLAIAVPYGVYSSRNPQRFSAVQEGVLYRCAQPTTRQIRHLTESLGLRTVLIVREGSSTRVPDETDFVRHLGLNVVHIPIPSRTAITPEHIEQFFACVDNPANRPVLVHCSAGRHRTGFLCALYRIERQGWTVQRALEEMCSYGFDTTDQSVVLEQLRRYVPGSAGKK